MSVPVLTFGGPNLERKSSPPQQTYVDRGMGLSS